ncbi:hypothetical protein V8F33_012459 [Rhypophila sp. PSN 637]
MSETKMERTNFVGDQQDMMEGTRAARSGLTCCQVTLHPKTCLQLQVWLLSRIAVATRIFMSERAAQDLDRNPQRDHIQMEMGRQGCCSSSWQCRQCPRWRSVHPISVLVCMSAACKRKSAFLQLLETNPPIFSQTSNRHAFFFLSTGAERADQRRRGSIILLLLQCDICTVALCRVLVLPATDEDAVRGTDMTCRIRIHLRTSRLRV